MMAQLPSVDGLARLDAAVWAELGARLRTAGLDGSYIAGMWQGGGRVLNEGVQKPIRIWRARSRSDMAAFAYRMFCLRDPVSARDACALLGGELVESLLASGVLVGTGSRAVVSPFDLQWFQGLLILCDDLSHGGDAVFGAGPGSEAFRALTPRTPVARSALDVGCGAGALALWLASQVEQVVATDINPRALIFLQINQAINQIENVEGRLGDLFEPVRGEAFDLVVSQPPFVPRTPQARSVLYRLSGPKGHELAIQIIEDLPVHLTPRGRALVVFESPVMVSGQEGDTVQALRSKRAIRTLLLLGAEVNSDAYSIRYAASELKRSVTRFRQSAVEMREHLEKQNIHGLRPAMCLVETDPGRPGWLEVLQATHDLWGQVSAETVARVLAGLSLLHDMPEQTSGIRLQIPEGSLEIRKPKAAEKVVLGLPKGYLSYSVELTQEEWEILERYRVDRPDDAFAQAVAVQLVQAESEVVRSMLSKLLRAGLLDHITPNKVGC